MEADDSQSRLLDAYLESKQLLAEAFQTLLRERIALRLDLLPAIKSQIEERMRARLANLLPAKYLRVAGYNLPHSYLYAYLSLFPGKPVSASVLRILTGDAVHTERRVRELRDLGLSLDARRTSGADVYVLLSTEADLDFAARFMARRNIQADKFVPTEDRLRYLGLLGE